MNCEFCDLNFASLLLDGIARVKSMVVTVSKKENINNVFLVVKIYLYFWYFLLVIVFLDFLNFNQFFRILKVFCFLWALHTCT